MTETAVKKTKKSTAGGNKSTTSKKPTTQTKPENNKMAAKKTNSQKVEVKKGEVDKPTKVVQVEEISQLDKNPPKQDLPNLSSGKPKKKKKFKMWSAFAILLLIIAVLVLLSWILKWAGVTTDVKTLTGTDPNGDPIWTVETVKIGAMGIVDVFYAPMKGFINKADVIIFILVLGAFINVLISSKALEGFSQQIVKKLKGKEIWAIIPLMIFFSIAGTTEGMAEESLGFYMIVIPLMMAAGFDVMTGLLIVLVGAGVGVIGSTVNPFVVTLAANGLNSGAGGVAQISVGDGLVWRLISWVILTGGAIGFVMWYANRVKKNPSKSVTFATLEGDKKFFLSEATSEIKMDWRKKLTLIVFAIAFAVMIVYLVGWDSIFQTTVMADHGKWINEHIPYITGIIPGWGEGGLDIVAGFFLISAIALGVINGLGQDGFLKEFMAGAADILSVVLVIATAAGVGVILENSHMQELFVNGLANSLGGINSEIGKIIILFILFLPLSFLIPSTSGFATAIFPLLAGSVMKDGKFQEAAASGSITAFSFASGIINLITPTSGVVMGAMAISRVDYGKFLKFIWPFILGLVGASIILLAIGGAIGGNIA